MEWYGGIAAFLEIDLINHKRNNNRADYYISEKKVLSYAMFAEAAVHAVYSIYDVFNKCAVCRGVSFRKSNQ